MPSAAQLWNTLAEHVVAALVFIPLIGAAFVILASRSGAGAARGTAIGNAAVTLILATIMIAHYDTGLQTSAGEPAVYQMVSVIGPWRADVETSAAAAPIKVESERTVPSPIAGTGIRLALGVDGVSLCFVSLCCILIVPALVAAADNEREHPAAMYALLLVLQSACIGLFAALDAMWFCFFAELALLSMYFLIGRWGGYERRAAVRKLFLFRFASSQFIVLGLLAVVVAHWWMSSEPGEPRPPLVFSIPQLTTEIPGLAALGGLPLQYWVSVRSWAFLLLFIGFAIQVPLVPFHTWFAPANVEAPSMVSVLLSGIGLKIGCYGFVRILLPLFSDVLIGASGSLRFLAVCGAVYGGLLTLAQSDLKKLVTYSCIPAMCLSVAGILSLNLVGVSGGILLAIGHALAIGALFLLVGAMEQRFGVRDLEAFGGLVHRYPRLGISFLFATLAFLGLPGTAGFVGDALTLMGITRGHPANPGNPIITIWALVALALVAWAYLWMLQRCFFGRFREPAAQSLLSRTQRIASVTDLTQRELIAIVVLLGASVAVGVFPQFVLNRIEPSLAWNLHGYGTARLQAENETVSTTPPTPPTTEPSTASSSQERFFDAVDLALGKAPSDRWQRFLIAVTAVLALAAVDRRENISRRIGRCLQLAIALIGAWFAFNAQDLILLYVAIELPALAAAYAIWQDGKESTSRRPIEFVVPSLIASLLLGLGFICLFGITGSAEFDSIRQVFAANVTAQHRSTATELGGLGTVAFLLIAAGLGFRAAIVPFHFGLSNAFEASTPWTGGLVATLPRAAAFAALIRLTHAGLGANAATAQSLFWVAAAASILAASSRALFETNIRRLIAQLVIANSGMALVGLSVASWDAGHSEFGLRHMLGMPGGAEAAVAFLIVSLIATVGLFAALSYLSPVDRRLDQIEDLNGLIRSAPTASACIVAFLLCLTGVPPFAGFWTRIGLFGSTLSVHAEFVGAPLPAPNTGFILLSLVMVVGWIATASAALRIIGAIVFAPQAAAARPAGGRLLLTGLVITALLSVVLAA